MLGHQDSYLRLRPRSGCGARLASSFAKRASRRAHLACEADIEGVPGSRVWLGRTSREADLSGSTIQSFDYVGQAVLGKAGTEWWSNGAMECWSTGVLEYRSIGVLFSRSRKFRHPLLQKCRNPFPKIVAVTEFAHIIAFQVELLV
jgi:hypothetical protein